MEKPSRLIQLSRGNKWGSDAVRIYAIETEAGEKGLARALKALGGGLGAKTGLYLIPVLTPDRSIKRQNGRRFKTAGEPVFTLTAQDRHGVSDGINVRRLTPSECELLQGFPKGYTDGYSDSQPYKCLGNAVTTHVITALMDRMYDGKYY